MLNTKGPRLSFTLIISTGDREERTMRGQSYEVPMVPPDLRREETIRQICDSLDYLEKVANDVFNRISNRVSENHSKLRAINERVNLAHARIDKVKDSKKATKVFSSAKYPAEKSPSEYQTVYKDSDDSALRAIKHSNYHLQSRHTPVDERVLKEKLQFYNVHLNLKKNKGKDDGSQGEGLGRLPTNIPSISSLLLFNTSENP